MSLDTRWVSIGTGKRNTDKIMSGCNQEFMAARLATEYIKNGKSDWFLPSRDELNALCKWAFNDTSNSTCNNDGNGALTLSKSGFVPGDYLSSSTDSADNEYYSYHQRFSSGQQGNSYYRNVVGYVRPIRMF